MYEDAIRTLNTQWLASAEGAEGEASHHPIQINALELIREGLPGTALLGFYKIWQLKQTEVASILGVSERHIQRLKSNGRLNPN